MIHSFISFNEGKIFVNMDDVRKMSFSESEQVVYITYKSGSVDFFPVTFEKFKSFWRIFFDQSLRS